MRLGHASQRAPRISDGKVNVSRGCACPWRRVSVVTRRSERARRSVRFQWECSRARVDRRRTITLGVGRYGARTEDGSAVRACILFEVVQSDLRQSYAGIRSLKTSSDTHAGVLTANSVGPLFCLAKKQKKSFGTFGNSFPGKRSAPSKFRTRSAADADVSAPSITPDASPEYPAGAFERSSPADTGPGFDGERPAFLRFVVNFISSP